MQIVLSGRKRVIELENMKKSLEQQLKEMSKMVQQQQEIIAMSRRDPLTGLRNRAGVSEQINNILKNKSVGAFFIMDMDNFKGVNDTYGHIEGDRVLVRFARALKKAIDTEDIVARLGGDEFIVFSPVAYDKQILFHKARHIVKLIERELVSPGKLVKVTVSMGIAIAPTNGVTYEALYDKADRALYYVKEDGKNAFKMYDDIKHADEKATCKRPQVSLTEITARLRERKMEGSFVVEYSNFEKIYRFMERNLERENREVQCVLFTVDDEMDGIADEYSLQRQMEHLQHAIVSSLRRGDVTAKYSSSQILALLMDVNKENAKLVIDRILENYKEEAGNGYMNVCFDFEQLSPNN